MVPIALISAVPLAAPVIVAAWLGGVYGLSRAIFGRVARKHAVRLQQTFDELGELIERLVRQA